MVPITGPTPALHPFDQLAANALKHFLHLTVSGHSSFTCCDHCRLHQHTVSFFLMCNLPNPLLRTQDKLHSAFTSRFHHPSISIWSLMRSHFNSTTPDSATLASKQLLKILFTCHRVLGPQIQLHVGRCSPAPPSVESPRVTRVRHIHC